MHFVKFCVECSQVIHEQKETTEQYQELIFRGGFYRISANVDSFVFHFSGLHEEIGFQASYHYSVKERARSKV